MDAKIKHLEFIQSVINRMTNNSFLLKGWCLTVIGAMFALKDGTLCAYAWIFPLFIGMFWLLDGYYLSQERRFVALYKEVIKRSDGTDFDMSTKRFCKDRNTWFSSIFSGTLSIFYGVLLVIVLLLIL